MQPEENGGAPRPMLADDWDVLLTQIDEGKVIPVVGRDLLVIEAEGRRAYFHHELSRRLAAALGVRPEELPKDPDIEEVAFRYLRSRDAEWDILYATLKRELQRYQPQVPEALRQLANIEPLRLFVSTTCDDLMARALRGGSRRVIEKAYLPSATTAISQDLPDSLVEGEVAVYSVFGRPDEAGDVVVTEEDALEFVHQLKVKLDPAGGELRNLGRRLRESHLMFLGCGFPDWLMRFFIRTLRGERFHSERRKLRPRVADGRADPKGSLVMFLQHYGARVYGGAPADFVADLHRRWEDRRRPTKAGPVSKRDRLVPMVTLACGPDTEPAARQVKEDLAEWNIGAEILRFRDTDEAVFRARIDASAVLVAYLSKGLLGERPDERLMADWQRIQRRRQDPNLAILSTLVVPTDAESREQLRSSRGWPKWFGASRRLLATDDVALSVVDAAFETGRIASGARVRACILAASEDRDAMTRLEKQLGATKWMTVWHPDKIRAGEKISARTAVEIEVADLIVLLVSADLLPNCERELTAALARHRFGQSMVVPVLVRACNPDSDLREMEMLPDDGQPVSSAKDPDLAWSEIAKALMRRACDFVLGAGKRGLGAEVGEEEQRSSQEEA